VDVAPDLPPVRGDRDRLVQVLINLLSNAVKFVASGSGRVAIRAAREGRDVTVRVTDNGPGVAPADQRMIFEKFRQAGDTLTGKPQGTGLGLPISRQIVEHLGGRLWLTSVPGEGATFAFALPAVGGRGARARTDDRGA
jgi:signal transduction histidine kinase